jgi:hypothetical protein
MTQQQINNIVDKRSRMTPIMKAKFATSCVTCGDKISPGKEIAKNEEGKWVHKHCAPESAQLL